MHQIYAYIFIQVYHTMHVYLSFYLGINRHIYITEWYYKTG